MIEFSRNRDGTASTSHAGDTYNTAVYLRRVADRLDAQVDVRFLTGVGDDPESSRLQDAWERHGVVSDAVPVPGRSVGAYLITTDEVGERSFTYWRDDSAAAELFKRDDWVGRVRGDLVYLSGITLQLMTDRSRRALLERLAVVREGGGLVCFDSNYRSSGWPDGRAAAAAMAELLEVCDLALLTLDDEIALGVCHDVVSCAERAAALGVGEIVVKCGSDGAWVHTTAGLDHVPTRPVVAADTTAAGDSFNGAYLAARIAGRTPIEAARLANEIAGRVALKRGAIVSID